MLSKFWRSSHLLLQFTLSVHYWLTLSRRHAIYSIDFPVGRGVNLLTSCMLRKSLRLINCSKDSGVYFALSHGNIIIILGLRVNKMTLESISSKCLDLKFFFQKRI
jgi:hypothetical protein